MSALAALEPRCARSCCARIAPAGRNHRPPHMKTVFGERKLTIKSFAITSARIAAIHAKLFHLRYQLLLSALLCVFIVNIFFPDNIYGGMAQMAYLPFQLLACFIVFKSKKRLLYLLCVIIGAIIALHIANSFFASSIQNEMTFCYICFYGGVFWEVIRQIYSATMKPNNIILAGICGLLLIGYCGFYIFLAIEFHQPGSFANLRPGIEAINDLFYFSYITIMTVGYGRITPNTWIAMNATVLVALVAYIYSWVVIATIVGEAMSARQAKALQNGKDKTS